MFEKMRKIFGPVAVGAIIGSIALVFIFYGVFNPQGGGGGGVGDAATVNGERISVQDFSREYQQRVDFYQNMMKGKVDMGLLEQLGLQQQVMDDLVRKKLIAQDAKRLGIEVSDDELKRKIQELPYFQKNGAFDAAYYQQILQANHFSPATFEEMIRQDLLRSHVMEFMQEQVKVSEEEVRSEYLAGQDRRQITYVMLSRDEAKKRVLVSAIEIEGFFKTPEGMTAAKTYYEQHKSQFIQPKKAVAKSDQKSKSKEKASMPEIEFFPFESVKNKVAEAVLEERKADEVSKKVKELATQLLNSAKKSEAALRSTAKALGLEVKTSEKFSKIENVIPGLGAVSELIDDAFKANSELTQMPKQYDHRGGVVVAMGLRAFKPEMTDFAKEHDKVLNQIQARKERALLEQWVANLKTKAKISINKEMLAEESSVEN